MGDPYFSYFLFSNPRAGVGDAACRWLPPENRDCELLRRFLEQPNEEKHNGHDNENVDECAENMEPQPADQPQHEQDHRDSISILVYSLFGTSLAAQNLAGAFLALLIGGTLLPFAIIFWAGRQIE